MPSERELNLILKLKDQASAVFKKFGSNSEKALKKLVGGAAKTITVLRKMGAVATKAFKSFTGGIRNAFRSLTSLRNLILTGIVGIALQRLSKAVLKSNVQWEVFETRLISLKGSEAAAAAALREFEEVAERVPFTLNEIVEGGIQLQSFLAGTGLASEDLAVEMADLAAFMGTTVPEAASAWGRAMAGGAGAADIFRERGVLTLLKVRSGVDDLTKLSLPEFRKVMIQVFSDTEGGIAGSADRLSKTFQGIVSIIDDQTQKLFRVALGPSGLDALKKKLGEILKVLKSPVTLKFVEKVAKGFISWIKSVKVLKKVIFPVLRGMVTGFFTIQRALLIVRGGLEALAVLGAGLKAVFFALLTPLALLAEALTVSILLPVRKVTQALAFLADILGIDGIAGALKELDAIMQSAEDGMRSLTKAAARGVVDSLKDVALLSKQVGRTMDEVAESAIDEAAALQILTDAERDLTEETRATASAMEEIVVKFGEITAQALAAQLAFGGELTFDFTPPETLASLEKWVGLLERTQEILGTIPTELAAQRFATLGNVISFARMDMEELGAANKKTTKEAAKQAKDRVAVFRFIRNSALKENKALFAVFKAADIAQAIIDTHAAATKALASAPPPANFALAAAVTAAGFANVNAIRSTSFGGGGGGGGGAPSGGGGGSFAAPPVETVPLAAPVEAASPFAGDTFIFNVTGAVGDTQQVGRELLELFEQAKELRE